METSSNHSVFKPQTVSNVQTNQGQSQKKTHSLEANKANAVAAQRVKELHERGFTDRPAITSTTFRGKNYERAEFTMNHDLSTLDKVKRGFAMVGAFPLLLSKRFRQETVDPIFRGKAKEVVMFEANQEEKVGHLGYDPNSTLTIAEYTTKKAQNPTIGRPVGDYFREQIGDKDHPRNPNVREINGMFVLREHRREGISSFMIISTSNAEKGNWEAAESVKYYYEKSGTSIKNDAESWRAIRKYIACKDDIDKGLDTKADKMAKEHLEKIKLTSEGTLPNLEDLRKSFRKVLGRKRIVISSKDNTWRAGSDNPNNPKENSSICGSFSKETKKELELIDNKNMMKHKPPLEGEKPFENEKDASEPADTLKPPVVGQNATGGPQVEEIKNDGPMTIQVSDDD